ncbi:MAG TPA: sulfur carrier protein ThiS [Xanthomonadales bacterium]|nr:sulfur carrier protein ThiS [Xanthomonadales bacterium]
MEIILNGAPRRFDAPLTVAQLLDAIGDGQRRVAVEVNLEIVPKTQHATRALVAGDRVEIVHALGGG